MERSRHLARFYELIDELRQRLGGCRRMCDCTGNMGWPARGVYFLFEIGEVRVETGAGPRVVRVGTHALTATSRTTLWQRLSQHRGAAASRLGNHRGSIFRLLVGAAMIRRTGTGPASWGVKADPGAAARALDVPVAALKAEEAPLERAVSEHIGAMDLLWLKVDEPQRGAQLRGYIERNAIALLSNHDKHRLDAASPDWLGHHSDRERVRSSHLWNNNHVNERYDPAFLDEFAGLVAGAGG